MSSEKKGKEVKPANGGEDGGVTISESPKVQIFESFDDMGLNEVCVVARTPRRITDAIAAPPAWHICLRF